MWLMVRSFPGFFPGGEAIADDPVQLSYEQVRDWEHKLPGMGFKMAPLPGRDSLRWFKKGIANDEVIEFFPKKKV